MYGPLHSVIKEIGDTDRYAKPKVSTTEETLGLMTTPKSKDQTKAIIPTPVVAVIPARRPNASPLQNGKPLKSALKKVTMSDLLKRSASELQINTDDISISQANQQLGAFSPSVIASHRQPKLRFNQYVEQCVALSIDEDKSKKRNPKVRMTEFKDVTDEEHDDIDATTSSDNYGDESDTSSVIMMHRKHNKLRSIKKIEPALLKTNSRSDRDLSTSGESSDEDEQDIMPAISASGYHSNNHHHRRKSTPSKYMDWDVESAESDALVKHIIDVSKGKRPMEPRDPIADQIPVLNTEMDGNLTEATQAKSDYDYEFDDDDWDTHSEHCEDIPFTASSMSDDISSASNQHTTFPNTSLPVVNNTRSMHSIQQEEQDGNSLFKNIAHWASSHLWPSDNSKQ